MWFEIIPSFIIIAAAMGAPHGLAYVLNWLVVGNCYRRELRTYHQRLQYLRDRRLTGDPYKLTGLENIPDDECVEEPREECENVEEPSGETKEDPKTEEQPEAQLEAQPEAQSAAQPEAECEAQPGTKIQ